MESVHPIKKKTLYREEIKEALRNAIFAGKLKPGDRIVETRWAKELGVSQSPVREAIRELEIIGLVENVPYQGSFVRKITEKDLKDSYLVRMALEQLGAEQACSKINEEQLKEIKECLDIMESAADTKDFNTYIKYDVQFHDRIMQVSDNDLLKRLWQQCNIREWTHYGTQFSNYTLEMLARRHEKIYQALVDRDSAAVIRETRLHIQELLEELEQRTNGQ